MLLGLLVVGGNGGQAGRQARPLVYAVGLELVVDEVVLGLAALAAHVALGPGVLGRAARVDVLDVLAQVARRGVVAPAVAADRPHVVVAQGRVEPSEILDRLGLARLCLLGRRSRRH